MRAATAWPRGSSPSSASISGSAKACGRTRIPSQTRWSSASGWCCLPCSDHAGSTIRIGRSSGIAASCACLQDIARCGSGVTVSLAGNEFAMSIPGLWRALLACIGLVGLAAIVPAAANAQVYRIAADRTTAGFTVSHLGILRQEGQFHRVSGTILLDPAHAECGSIDVAIDLSSVDTGWKLRDDFIRGEDMLD